MRHQKYFERLARHLQPGVTKKSKKLCPPEKQEIKRKHRKKRSLKLFDLVPKGMRVNPFKALLPRLPRYRYNPVCQCRHNLTGMSCAGIARRCRRLARMAKYQFRPSHHSPYYRRRLRRLTFDCLRPRLLKENSLRMRKMGNKEKNEQEPTDSSPIVDFIRYGTHSRTINLAEPGGARCGHYRFFSFKPHIRQKLTTVMKIFFVYCFISSFLRDNNMADFPFAEGAETLSSTSRPFDFKSTNTPTNDPKSNVIIRRELNPIKHYFETYYSNQSNKGYFRLVEEPPPTDSKYDFGEGFGIISTTPTPSLLEMASVPFSAIYSLYKHYYPSPPTPLPKINSPAPTLLTLITPKPSTENNLPISTYENMDPALRICEHRAQPFRRARHYKVKDLLRDAGKTVRVTREVLFDAAVTTITNINNPVDFYYDLTTTSLPVFDDQWKNNYNFNYNYDDDNDYVDPSTIGVSSDPKQILGTTPATRDDHMPVVTLSPIESNTALVEARDKNYDVTKKEDDNFPFYRYPNGKHPDIDEWKVQPLSTDLFVGIRSEADLWKNLFDRLLNFSVVDIATIVVGGSLSIATIFGNVLVMIAFAVDRTLRTEPNFFLLSLAMADFLIGIISMPLSLIYILARGWPLGPMACDLWLAVDYLNSNSSVFNLLIISLDRFFSVRRPLTYRENRTPRKVACAIAITWILSLLLWPPWILFWPLIEGHRTVPRYMCYIPFLESNKYITIITSVLAYWLPVSIMCFLYLFIWLFTKRRLDNIKKWNEFEKAMLSKRIEKVHSANCAVRLAREHIAKMAATNSASAAGSARNSTCVQLNLQHQQVQQHSAGNGNGNRNGNSSTQQQQQQQQQQRLPMELSTGLAPLIKHVQCERHQRFDCLLCNPVMLSAPLRRISSVSPTTSSAPSASSVSFGTKIFSTHDYQEEINMDVLGTSSEAGLPLAYVLGDRIQQHQPNELETLNECGNTNQNNEETMTTQHKQSKVSLTFSVPMTWKDKTLYICSFGLYKKKVDENCEYCLYKKQVRRKRRLIMRKREQEIQRNAKKKSSPVNNCSVCSNWPDEMEEDVSAERCSTTVGHKSNITVEVQQHTPKQINEDKKEAVNHTISEDKDEKETITATTTTSQDSIYTIVIKLPQEGQQTVCMLKENVLGEPQPQIVVSEPSESVATKVNEPNSTENLEQLVENVEPIKLATTSTNDAPTSANKSPTSRAAATDDSDDEEEQFSDDDEYDPKEDEEEEDLDVERDEDGDGVDETNAETSTEVDVEMGRLMRICCFCCGRRHRKSKAKKGNELDDMAFRLRASVANQNDMKAAKTLSAILLAFILTWTPYNVLGKYIICYLLRANKVKAKTEHLKDFFNR